MGHLLRRVASQLTRQRRLFYLAASANRPRFFASGSSHLSQSEFEEQYHLANQLSRPTDRQKLNQKDWSAVAKKFSNTAWHLAEPIGMENFSWANYEHEGLAELHSRSYGTGVLLEIRDVRVPASSHHPSFTRLARHRVHLICYTHADLIDASARDRVERWTYHTFPEAMCTFIDTREGKVKDDMHMYERTYDGLIDQLSKKANNIALTVGVANVGKSSVLMALLRLARDRGLIPTNVKINKANVKIKKGAKTPKKQKKRMKPGNMPGVLDTPGKTRQITEYLLREKPRAYFMDVPGITPPHFFFRERPEAWFGYLATNLLPLGKNASNDSAMLRACCDYVLSCANRDGIFHYVDKLNLSQPTNSIDEALSSFSSKRFQHFTGEKLLRKRCEMFLKLFNTGNLGPLILDDMSNTSWRPFEFRDEHFLDNRQREQWKSK